MLATKQYLKLCFPRFQQSVTSGPLHISTYIIYYLLLHITYYYYYCYIIIIITVITVFIVIITETCTDLHVRAGCSNCLQSSCANRIHHVLELASFNVGKFASLRYFELVLFSLINDLGLARVSQSSKFRFLRINVHSNVSNHRPMLAISMKVLLPSAADN